HPVFKFFPSTHKPLSGRRPENHAFRHLHQNISPQNSAPHAPTDIARPRLPPSALSLSHARDSTFPQFHFFPIPNFLALASAVAALFPPDTLPTSPPAPTQAPRLPPSVASEHSHQKTAANRNSRRTIHPPAPAHP